MSETDSAQRTRVTWRRLLRRALGIALVCVAMSTMGAVVWLFGPVTWGYVRTEPMILGFCAISIVIALYGLVRHRSTGNKLFLLFVVPFVSILAYATIASFGRVLENIYDEMVYAPFSQ